MNSYAGYTIDLPENHTLDVLACDADGKLYALHTSERERKCGLLIGKPGQMEKVDGVEVYLARDGFASIEAHFSRGGVEEKLYITSPQNMVQSTVTRGGSKNGTKKELGLLVHKWA